MGDDFDWCAIFGRAQIKYLVGRTIRDKVPPIRFKYTFGSNVCVWKLAEVYVFVERSNSRIRDVNSLVMSRVIGVLGVALR